MVVNNRWLLKMAVQNNVCVCENSCKRIENDCCCLFDAILCIQILLLFSKCIDRIYASPWNFRIWFLFIPEYIFFPSINRECLKKEKKRMKVSAWNASLKWCGVCVCVFIPRCIIKSMLGRKWEPGYRKYIHTCPKEQANRQWKRFHTFHTLCKHIMFGAWKLTAIERTNSQARVLNEWRQENGQTNDRPTERRRRKNMDQYLKASTCEMVCGAMKRRVFKNCMQYYADSSKALYACECVCVCCYCCWVLFEYLTVKLIMQSTCELK